MIEAFRATPKPRREKTANPFADVPYSDTGDARGSNIQVGTSAASSAATAAPAADPGAASADTDTATEAQQAA